MRKMTDSKIYLNVPYVEKDEAKALGARWDAANKKWYVPGNIDIAAFAKWRSEAANSSLSSTTAHKPRAQNSSALNSSAANHTAGGVTTYAAIKDFVAYDGDETPWS
jgi:hypothetical protein